jgi:hypothetical protein
MAGYHHLQAEEVTPAEAEVTGSDHPQTIQANLHGQKHHLGRIRPVLF